VNFLFSERMKIQHSNQEALVSILVPARNEAGHIEQLIQSVQQQEYQHFELIVCDDQSEDSTAALVKKYQEADQRIRLIGTDHLPEGWLGKNHACHSLSLQAKGNYLLFLDADVIIEGNLIARAIRHMQHYGLALITIFPKQIMHSAGELKTVPVMNYILLTLLPLILVRKSSFSSLAAANGQFMFFDAKTYHAIKPHALLRANKVEDIAMARLLKKNKQGISCLASEKQISCRMYHNYGEAVQGFSRNIVTYFGNSKVLAILFFLITSLGIVPIVWTGQWFFIVSFILTTLFTRVLVAITSNQSVYQTLKHLPHHQIAMCQFILQSIHHQINKQETWKGRNIST
ncbi:MAG: glycosyltransferase, partial [Prolixibacteraceae bacterium]|nr:glycosyltransferase [Prolixibacteraceae bacterium]